MEAQAGRALYRGEADNIFVRHPGLLTAVLLSMLPKIFKSFPVLSVKVHYFPDCASRKKKTKQDSCRDNMQPVKGL